MATTGAAPFVRRLAARFEPGCWVGLVIRAVPAAEHEQDGAIVRTPDHFLGAAWAPADGVPTRWPEAVVIGSPTADNALAELLRHVPAEARLYLTGADDVDAALAAEILLAADRNLEPYQQDALAVFIDAQRARTQVAIGERYTDRDAGFERFRARVLGEDGNGDRGETGSG
jgi:hypothetical protein